VNLREHGRHAVRLLLAQRTPVTGIVCLSDELALGVIAELTARSVRVPQDVSVIGYDDSPPAAMATPALTTVRQPAREKGAAAARLLLAELGRAAGPRAASGPGRESAPAGDAVVLATELVVRASTAPAS
jgi:LacI family transcriptional regulator